MNDVLIDLKDDRNGFEPGDEIQGAVSWSSDQPAQRIELRLFWFTRGKGTEDAGIVETVTFDQPLPHETRSFRFRLPGAPYSFSGSLISLVWALELVSYPSKQVVRREIEMGPGGREVKLSAVPADKLGQNFISIKVR